ncbi:MAG: hypothetical protein Q8P46_12595 [Hyphomicrobiales bacterium]|nr:hypothetical protein [Hyphomicrobiales bacterium]
MKPSPVDPETHARAMELLTYLGLWSETDVDHLSADMGIARAEIRRLVRYLADERQPHGGFDIASRQDKDYRSLWVLPLGWPKIKRTALRWWDAQQNQQSQQSVAVA